MLQAKPEKGGDRDAYRVLQQPGHWKPALQLEYSRLVKKQSKANTNQAHAKATLLCFTQSRGEHKPHQPHPASPSKQTQRQWSCGRSSRSARRSQEAAFSSPTEDTTFRILVNKRNGGLSFDGAIARLATRPPSSWRCFRGNQKRLRRVPELG